MPPRRIASALIPGAGTGHRRDCDRPGCLCVCEAAGLVVVESRVGGCEVTCPKSWLLGLSQSALDCRAAPRCRQARRLPSLVGDHDAPKVVGEASLQAARGLAWCVAPPGKHASVFA
jgi:hypothetical protein